MNACEWGQTGDMINQAAMEWGGGKGERINLGLNWKSLSLLCSFDYQPFQKENHAYGI